MLNSITLNAIDGKEVGNEEKWKREFFGILPHARCCYTADTALRKAKRKMRKLFK
jgi:hypothetical protein